MKKIKVTYYCDYCKQVVDTDSDTVRAILPGRIGYKGSFLADTATITTTVWSIL